MNVASKPPRNTQSFKELRSFRLRLESIRLRPISQFAYVLIIQLLYKTVDSIEKKFMMFENYRMKI